MSSPCNPNVRDGTELSENQAEQLLQRLKNLAMERSKKTGEPLVMTLHDIGRLAKDEEQFMQMIHERNDLLTTRAKRDVTNFVNRFKTMGEGLLALIQGSNKNVPGARDSIDYQAKSLHGKFFGRMVAEMDEAGVLGKFKKSDPDFVKDVYNEMGSFDPSLKTTRHSVTGNQDAFKVANIIENVTSEMVARQNRAGAYIRQVPGYIIRQTHDMSAIRAVGDSQSESYRNWSNFVEPLLDFEKTFRGADSEKVLRNIHQGLYTGVHGPMPDDLIMGSQIIGSLANKVSENRVLWFKDPESALKYNQAFGTKNFKEAVLTDLHSRARSIALMENLGPSPDQTLASLMKEWQYQVRDREDSATQLDSLKDWRIKAAMDELTGRSEIPQNPNMSRIIGTGKVLLQMAKMGAVTLSSFADKAFLHSEMAFQGISNLETLAKNITGLLPRSPEQKQMLRLMGVAMDGLLGNALSRYSNHSTVSGWAHTAQKWFFDLNLLNSWTDANKATAAELMSAHLGQLSDKTFYELPGQFKNILSWYNITPQRWDLIRMTGVDHNGSKFITPEQIKNIPHDTIVKHLEADGIDPTMTNIQREYDKVETSLRTYFADRVDIAIPTPGIAERKYATWGTQAGTPLGEAVRLLMLFKSFPITILDKVVGRNIYGRGADTVMQFLKNDHRGKFDLAMMIGMVTAAGYMSGAVRDALKGRTPKPLVNPDGSINVQNLNDAALRGGSLGIMGDVLMSQYDHDYNNFLQYAAGPVLGQLSEVGQLKTLVGQGKAQQASGVAGKLLLDNAPMINLFYARPILDYFALWNLEEMMSPGTLRKRESAVERRYGQGFFIRPSETVNR